MRITRIIPIAVIIATAMLAATGPAMAQTISSGSMSESDSMTWTISSGTIGVLNPGDTQTTTNYQENTLGQNGQTSYMKTQNFNTGSANFGQFNVLTNRILSFDGIGDGTGNGRMTSDESVGFDSVGAANDTLPAFHTNVQAGSSFDLAQGSIASQAQARTVSSNPMVPVALNYNVGLQGLNNGPVITTPAIGSAAAFFNGHIEQGRVNSTGKSSDLTFSQRSTASGLITSFTKSMSYVSGFSTSLV
jgi:hypothetical protein